jgi:hypothetical protein
MPGKDLPTRPGATYLEPIAPDSLTDDDSSQPRSLKRAWCTLKQGRKQCFRRGDTLSGRLIYPGFEEELHE